MKSKLKDHLIFWAVGSSSYFHSIVPRDDTQRKLYCVRDPNEILMSPLIFLMHHPSEI